MQYKGATKCDKSIRTRDKTWGLGWVQR